MVNMLTSYNLHSSMVRFKVRNIRRVQAIEEHLHSSMVRFKASQITDIATIRVNLHSSMVRFKVLII